MIYIETHWTLLLLFITILFMASLLVGNYSEWKKNAKIIDKMTHTIKSMRGQMVKTKREIDELKSKNI